VSLLAVSLAVVGTVIVVYQDLRQADILRGFLLVQASNLAFAFGQIRYRLAMASAPEIRDHDVFAWLYLGALAITGAAAAVTMPWTQVRVSATQWLVLLYLGVLASGVCFFLWNLGARRTHAGTLAIFNNAKIPLAVACSLLVFREKADVVRLVAGGGLMLVALALNERYRPKSETGGLSPPSTQRLRHA
jgi:drug/metabolite transporter (DMT)-like permease